MDATRTRRIGRVCRWVARLWALAVLGMAIMMVVAPDPYATEPVALGDMALLGFWGAAFILVSLVVFIVPAALYLFARHSEGAGGATTVRA